MGGEVRESVWVLPISVKPSYGDSPSPTISDNLHDDIPVRRIERVLCSILPSVYTHRDYAAW